MVWFAAGWAVLAVLSTQVPPRWWGLLAFGALTTPAALILNGLLAVSLALRRRSLALAPLAVLILAWGYVQRGFAVHAPPDAAAPVHVRSRLPALATDPDAEKEGAAVAARGGSDALRVLSYNVRIFNFYKSLASPGYRSSREQVEWLARQPADIMCLQEYYNQSTRWSKYPFFQTTVRIGRGRYSSVSVAHKRGNQEFGLAIFSRFPVVRHGIITFGQLTQNHTQWADIRRPAHAGRPADTVRVYNVHFQSMALDEGAIVATTRRRAWLDAAGLDILRRFRTGAAQRSRQADAVAAHIRACRLPVILCGDFNDVPYSYTYSAFNNFLVNAHQAAGAGVGSTYNGRLPLLRIDNQFASPAHFEPVWVKVHDTVRFSDHYPLEAVYRVRWQ